MRLLNKILIVGGDKRNVYLINMLYEKGCNVSGIYIDASQHNKDAQCAHEILSSADTIILPLPCTRDGKHLNAPLCDEKINLESIYSYLSPNAVVFGGMLDIEEFEKRGISAHDYAIRTDFAALNAVPTAEGAIEAAMKLMSTTIFGSKCLVSGFGKCGKILCNTLKGLGASVTVAARNPRDLSMAEAFGYNVTSIAKMHTIVGNFDIIFNTVSHPIFGEAELKKIKPHTPFIDIASLPGGIDAQNITHKNIDYVFLPGIPGKYSPQTAAEIIMKTIRNIIAESGKDADLWI